MTMTKKAYLSKLAAIHGASREAHWSVSGRAFLSLHEMFDQIDMDAQAWADDLVEIYLSYGEGVEIDLPAMKFDSSKHGTDPKALVQDMLKHLVELRMINLALTKEAEKEDNYSVVTVLGDQAILMSKYIYKLNNTSVNF